MSKIIGSYGFTNTRSFNVLAMENDINDVIIGGWNCTNINDAKRYIISNGYFDENGEMESYIDVDGAIILISEIMRTNI